MSPLLKQWVSKFKLQYQNSNIALFTWKLHNSPGQVLGYRDVGVGHPPLQLKNEKWLLKNHFQKINNTIFFYKN